MSGWLCLNSWSWTIGGWWKDGRTKHSGVHEQSDETDEYNWTMEKSDFSALLVFKLPTELYTMLESWKHWQHFANIKYQVFIPTVDRIFISSKWWWPYLIHTETYQPQKNTTFHIPYFTCHSRFSVCHPILWSLPQTAAPGWSISSSFLMSPLPNMLTINL